jgi:hypothetical protein
MIDVSLEEPLRRQVERRKEEMVEERKENVR